MGDEIFLTPEITMHEEAGEITLQGHPEEMEIDDYEPELPFANGEIPAEISITKVTGTSRATLSGKPKLHVRRDLGNGVHFGSMQRAMPQNRPPPLMRGGLPPMPRLRMGGPRSSMHPPMHQHNHLMSMMNLMPTHPIPNMRPAGMRSTRPLHPPPMMSLPPRGMPLRMPMNGGNPYPIPRSIPMPQPPPTKTMINVPSKAYSTVASNIHRMQQQNRRRTSSPHSITNGPPPMVRAGLRAPAPPQGPRQMPQLSNGNMNSSKSVQVRTVFVPPPMNRPATQSPQMSSNGNGGQIPRQTLIPLSNGPPMIAQENPGFVHIEGELEIDDAEDEVLDEEELDDVEPDVNPQTNEVDDVEPEDGDYRHEVTVSITSVKKQPNDTQNSQEQFTTSADQTEEKVVTRQGKPRETKTRPKKKKKKRKAFRGINYRFDGSSIKKRPGKKTPSIKGDVTPEPLPNGSIQDEEERDPSMLAYLGIQRKGSTESKQSVEECPELVESGLKPGQKAKKSFKPMASRTLSIDETSSIDSATGLKRRLSLSEVLSAQKRVRSDQQQAISIRSGFSSQVSPPPPQPTKNGAVNGIASISPVDSSESEGKVVTSSRLRPREQPTNSIKSEAELPLQPCVCLCAKTSAQLTQAHAPVRSGKMLTCQAIEVVGASRVGCKNEVKDLKYRQVLESNKKRVYCEAHIQRLKSHHCCGFCGEFCAHGMFFMCRPNKRSPPHFFHKRCYQKRDAGDRRCPHCHLPDQPVTVQLKLAMLTAPLSLLQSSSKMSFVKDTTKKSDLILRGEAAITYKMANGTIISSEGLPQGIDDDVLKKVLSTLEDKQNLKHATRNMYIPVKSGDNVKLVQLLSLGYSPNQRFSEAEGGTPLHVAACEGHVLTTHILVQAGSELDTLNDEQNSALMMGSIKGKHEIVRYILQAGADPTLRGDDGMTCLHLATQSGHLECTHVILNQNNLPRNFMNLQDEGGWTPLVWACENRHEPVIKYLLERGANPLITDAEGNIALHWAALAGSRHTCELLINAGCDVNATNNIGETPLHIALRQDHYDCVVLFLMRRARLDIHNHNGQLPVDCMVSKDVQCATIVRMSTTLQNMMKECKKSITERIVCNDITHAKETNPIQCINSIDEANEPSDYVYVSKNCATTSVPIDTDISKLQHCQCADTCSTEDSCHCSDLSVKSWYDMDGRLKEGFDFKDPPMIFECNEMCKCNVSICHNRVLQHGITSRFQVARTYGMGWGVKALAPIQKGSFVCEYVGEVISDSEADTREDSYLFDLDNRDGETFCIDANRYGNIARFINHCCTPNLVPVKVFSNHQDLRFPHIALFASRNIAKGEELGFDYGEKFWVIKHKQFTCHCASDKCKYNRNNIQSFLKEYYIKIGESPPKEDTLVMPPLPKTENGKAPPMASDEVPKKPDEVPEKPDEVPKKVDEAPKKADEAQKKEDDGPKKPDEGPKENGTGVKEEVVEEPSSSKAKGSTSVSSATPPSNQTTPKTSLRIRRARKTEEQPK